MHFAKFSRTSFFHRTPLVAASPDMCNESKTYKLVPETSLIINGITKNILAAIEKN